MKQKILKLCSLIATCFVLLFSLTGCGDRAITNIEIKSGTFEYTYEQDEVVSFEDLVVVIHYNDETSVEVNYGDEGLTVSSLSTEEIGKKKVDITYGGKTVSVEVTVKTPSETTLLVRSIATLPAVDEITTQNRAAIAEMRTKYDALSNEGKALITNYSVLQAAEAKLAELDLVALKENAIAELNAYKVEANYSSSKWALVVAAKDTGVLNINAATTTAEVNTAVANAKAAMDEIETKVVELAAYKVNVKTQFNAYVQTDYSSSNWTLVRLAISDGKEAIDAANTIAEVDQALANALTTLNAIPTLEDEFDAYKASKLQALSNMITIKEGHIVDANDNRLYDDANETSITTVLQTAVSSITNATTTEAIDTAYNSVVTAVNNAKLKVVTDVEALISALPTTITLEDKAAVEAARDAYDALSNENRSKVSNYATLTAAETAISSLQDIAEVRSEWKNRLDTNYTNNQTLQSKYDTDEWNDILDYVSDAKVAIDAAANSSAIIDIYNETVANIATVKEKVVTDVEDQLTALNKTIALTDETSVVAVRNAYDALTGAQKDSISSEVYGYLTKAESEIVRLKFEAYKESAIATLDAKLESCGNDKYNATNYAYIESLINVAKAKINDDTEVTTNEDVDGVVQDVTEAILDVKIKVVTDVEDLIAALASKEESDLTTVYKPAVEEARAAYDALTEANKGSVSNYSALLAAEANVVAKELAAYKATKIAELNEYLPTGNVESDYGPTKMATINSLRAEGANNINAATNTTDVNTAYGNATDAIDAVETQDDDHWTVLGWDKPANIQTYEDMLRLESSSEAAYIDATTDTTYLVGDDNAFKLQPVIEAEAPSSTNSQTITEYRNKSIIKMSTDNGATYSVVLKDDINNAVTDGYSLSTYVEGINEYTFEFDFTSAAIGNYFEISVYPYYGDNVTDFEVKHAFKVVDGYNVTKAIELGVIYNANDPMEKTDSYRSRELQALTEWKNLMSTKGVEWKDVNGIVLHDDIRITVNDIPSMYLNGSYLHDYVAIYDRVVNGTFNFYGNYFTVDASALPIVDIYSTTEDNASHLPLINIWAGDVSCSDLECYEDIAASRTANIKNVTFIGNGNIASQDTDKGMGSMVMGKFSMITSNLTNVNIRSFMASIMPYDRDSYAGITNIDKVKSNGAFQNNLFLSGGSTVNITNSMFGSCGGPSIISSDESNVTGALQGVPYVSIDSSSEIYNMVAGTEPWFDQFGIVEQTLLPLLYGIDNLIDENNADDDGIIIDSTSKMNMIHVGIRVDKSSSTGFGEYKGETHIGLDEDGTTFDVDFVNATTNQSSPTLHDVVASLKGEYGIVPIIVQGSNGASVYLGEGFAVLGGSASGFSGSEYITIYMSGFSVVLEYMAA